MTSIKNLASYADDMRHTLSDKIFFMDKIDAQVFVDFGCGDGSLLNHLGHKYPDHVYIGFDNNPNMIELANTHNDLLNVRYVDSLKEAMNLLNLFTVEGGRTCLILSSVLHEVYSYGDSAGILTFYRFMYSGIFDYICLRDMMPSRTLIHATPFNYLTRIKKIVISGNLPIKTKHLIDFEKRWGSIDHNLQFYHFLLKYRFIDNWKRELEENYFPVLTDQFEEFIPDTYRILYKECFLLPFLKERVAFDFGIELVEKTHVKYILAKTSAPLVLKLTSNKLSEKE